MAPLSSAIWQVYAILLLASSQKGTWADDIFPTGSEWIHDIEERDPTIKPSPIAGLGGDVFDAIKKLQPFREKTVKARQNDALMHLLRMSNADKHRVLHTGAVHTGRLEQLYFAPKGYLKITKKRVPQPGGRVERGAEIARVKVDWLREPDCEIGVHFKAPAQIGFSEPGKKWVSTIRDLYRIVNRILEIGADLERFLVPEALWFRGLRLSLGADPLLLPWSHRPPPKG